ncbi:hypothetical protein BKA67DRAFT_676064 [Truncatella angustata]|uniref:Uncharacterized protein n=1 Tax=Truncatella angustata TaxID=152316 RepID=A0A9P9A0H2_9PEZI|nr:uncharacterized protein BKA67DRAFT_676064 [Truncatella angustata]KAH6656004.1 hypothetical protein BKA67DRAFT_676064 [Truncatella angustata]
MSVTSNPDFGKETTATEVSVALSKNISGKTVLITGVSPGGLGEATALAIASQKPELLILAARDAAKAEAVANKLHKQFPELVSKVIRLDLSSQTSIREAADEINGVIHHLDILINNAGVMSVQERTLSEDGYEIQFAVNHLGHFLLTNLLMPKLLVAAKHNEPGATRVVNLTGNWHNFSPIRFSDINFTTNELPPEELPNVALMSKMGINCDKVYIPEAAYGQSKAANILFCLYIKHHLRQRGVTAVALNPGGILTNIGRHYDEEEVQRIVKSGLLNKNPNQGSATTLVAAFDPALNETEAIYLMDCQITQPGKHANSLDVAKKLWELSEKWAKQKFDLEF